jgi:elongation factor P--(R)-beta-lysine ligase
LPERARLASRLPALTARAQILRATRAYFEAQGFLEVETPLRVPSPGQEVHLTAFAAEDGRYLITSPEYHMKRLVAGGAGRIFQLTRAFRAGERGPQHQPEFTIVEWYRAGEPLEAIAADCEALLRAAAQAVGRYPLLPVPAARAGFGPTIAVDQPFERATIRALIARHAGFELAGDESAPALAARAAAAGIATGQATAWDDLFFQIFLDRVEPQLGRARPTFVFDWPAPLAALARRKPDDPRLCDRFELYAGGLELANAFGELTEPDEQRARFVAESAVRRALGKAVYPVDERLLGALSHMPETSGVALGFDRLVMLALGATDIREVIAFADDEI